MSLFATIRRRSRLACAGLLVACAGGCVVTPVPPAPPAGTVPIAPRPHTLWSFLGVDRLVVHSREKHHRMMARLGQHIPELEPKPALVLNTSPEAANSSSVAVQNAAHVLIAEQQAPQKMKAIKAVAKVGAAGYPQVEEALLAGLDDRNPKVRQATVQAILNSARTKCEPCDETGNCTHEIRRRLWEIGFGLKPNGCPTEPSPPVRRLARLALDRCGGPCEEPLPPPVSAEPAPPSVIEEVLGAEAGASLPPEPAALPVLLPTPSESPAP